MTPPYSVGDKIDVVETKFGTIGLLICADTFNDEILKKVKEKKPEIMLIPYGWAAPEKQWPEHGKRLVRVVKRTSKFLDCPVIGTTLVGQISHGPWTGQIYGGLSVAYDNESDNLFIGKDRERDIRICTITVKED